MRNEPKYIWLRIGRQFFHLSGYLHSGKNKKNCRFRPSETIFFCKFYRQVAGHLIGGMISSIRVVRASFISGERTISISSTIITSPSFCFQSLKMLPSWQPVINSNECDMALYL